MPHKKEGNSDYGSGAITSEYRGGDKLPEEFCTSNFAEATYIAGETLERFWERPDLHVHPSNADIKFFLVKKPSHLQVEFGCDACPSYHKKKNLSCSMTMKRETPYMMTGYLYPFMGKPKPMYAYHIVERIVPAGKNTVYGAWVVLISM